jgi:DNA-binding PadR family transcriptional regulator
MMKKLLSIIGSITASLNFVHLWIPAHEPTNRRSCKISKIDAAILLYLNDQSNPVNGLKVFNDLVKKCHYTGSNSGVYSSLYKLNRMQFLENVKIEAKTAQGGRKQTAYQISHSGKRVIVDLNQHLYDTGINLAPT